MVLFITTSQLGSQLVMRFNPFKRQPDKLRVVWTRRNRRICTKLHGWQPGIKNPYRGTVLWQLPENVDITVTLFKDPNADEFEDKDWTLIIENETKGHRKVLASVDVNMKNYANATSATFDLTLKLKPLSVKVVDATLKLTLTCIFLKEGKATDEDMQSLASLMSLKHSDIGNLDDFNDSDEEDRRTSTGTSKSVAATAPLPPVRKDHDEAWRPTVNINPLVTVHSERDLRSSSSSSSVPNLPHQACHLLQTSLKSSLSSHYTAPTHLPDLSGSSQPSRPTHYDFTVPAFTRAHPPALPKIFQPTAGSVPVSVSRRPSGGQADVSIAKVSRCVASSPRPLSSTFPAPSAPPFSLSSIFSSSSQQTAPPAISWTATAAVAPGARAPQSIPPFSPPISVSSPDSSVLGHFPPGSVPLPAPCPLKTCRESELGATLTRPTSMPSASETASWQREWRSPEVKPSLCPIPITLEEPVHQQAVQSSDSLRRPASASLPPSALGPPLKKGSSFKSPINTAISPLPKAEIRHAINMPSLEGPPLSLSHPSEVTSCTVPSPFPRSLILSESLSPAHSFHVAVPSPVNLNPILDSSLHTDTSLAPISNSPHTPHPNVSAQLSSVHFPAPFSTAAEVNTSDAAQTDPFHQVQTLEWRHQVVPTVFRPNVRRPTGPFIVNNPTNPLSPSSPPPVVAGSQFQSQTTIVLPLIGHIPVPPSDTSKDLHRQLSILQEEDYPNAVYPGEENADTKTSNAQQSEDFGSSKSKAEHMIIANHRSDREPAFQQQIVMPAPRPESMVSQMQSTPKSPSVPQAHSFDMGVAEKTPSNTALQTIQSPVIDKEYMPPLAEVKCTLSQESIAVQAICLDKEESLKLTNEPTNLHNIPTDQNEQEINLATELTFSPEKTEIDQGAKSIAAFLPFCPRTPVSPWSSTCDNGSTRIREEVNNLPTGYQKSNQYNESVKNIADVSECSDNAHSPQFAQVHMAKIKADNNESNKTDFFLSAAKASHIFLFPFGEDIEMEEDIQWPKDESLLLEDSQEKRINTLAPKDTEYQDRQYFEDACESQLSKSTILDISLLQRNNQINESYKIYLLNTIKDPWIPIYHKAKFSQTPKYCKYDVVLPK
ncbi:uncharacterized protein ehbp1l1a isoform X1 [Tachysurus ichikawai]